MFELREDSCRVESGRILTGEGILLERPAILVYGRVLTKVGNYNSLFKEMLSLRMNEGDSNKDFELHLLNLIKYPLEYFNADDACYVIRRCCELVDDEDFVKEFVRRYGNIGFFEWFETEKRKIPIRTRVI